MCTEMPSEKVNDLEGLSRALGLLLFDRPCHFY